MSKIVVTGANGQLAQCIRNSTKTSRHNFLFFAKESLDITDMQQVLAYFESQNPDFCINCAAYTAVDKAESEHERAYNTNVLGALNLAKACKNSGTKLIHISTDYVFDGENTTPYKEMDNTAPLNVYGQTKLEGELAISEHLSNYIIIRTSWLYSEFGSNFLKTMMRMGKEKDTLKIVSDQIGTPTYAADLADLVILLVNENTDKYGLYHFSNTGVTSWFDFARTIFELGNIKCKLEPIATKEYPTAAKRPLYTVLNKQKIKAIFGVETLNWRTSLAKCMQRLN